MSRQLLPNKIIAILDKEILSGKISSHQRISELEIAKRLGISRAPVREAFIHLEERGLLERIRGGRRVKEITEEDIKEISEVINMLETFSAFMAIDRESREYMSDLEEILLQLEESIKKRQRNEYMKLNYAFHDRIVSASGNKILTDLYRDFVRRFRWTSLINYTEYMDHRGIFEALKAADKELISRLITEHRKDFLKALLSKIRHLKKLGATSVRGLTLK